MQEDLGLRLQFAFINNHPSRVRMDKCLAQASAHSFSNVTTWCFFLFCIICSLNTWAIDQWLDNTSNLKMSLWTWETVMVKHVMNVSVSFEIKGRLICKLEKKEGKKSRLFVLLMFNLSWSYIHIYAHRHSCTQLQP